jgi:prepilin-type N-terminal cleavage/methylation domain-containing protein
MRNFNEKGFSMVELLCVLVIVGVIAAVAVPSLTKGIRAAEAGAVFSTMRTISSSQVSVYTAKSRFGRLDELNNMLGNGIGAPIGPNQLTRNRFVIDMVPAIPTDIELKDGYVVTATRRLPDEAQVYKFELTQTGEIRQILP